MPSSRPVRIDELTGSALLQQMLSRGGGSRDRGGDGTLCLVHCNQGLLQIISRIALIWNPSLQVRVRFGCGQQEWVLAPSDRAMGIHFFLSFFVQAYGQYALNLKAR